MGIQSLASELIRVTFSDLPPPETESYITLSLLRVSIRSSLASGTLALITAIFNRFISSEGIWRVVTSFILKISLSSCITSSSIGAYLIYKDHQQLASPNQKKLNDHLLFFLKGVSFVVAGTTSLSFWVFLRENHPLHSIGKEWFYPLTASEFTSFFLYYYHRQQLDKVREKTTVV